MAMMNIKTQIVLEYQTPPRLMKAGPCKEVVSAKLDMRDPKVFFFLFSSEEPSL